MTIEPTLINLMNRTLTICQTADHGPRLVLPGSSERVFVTYLDHDQPWAEIQVSPWSDGVTRGVRLGWRTPGEIVNLPPPRAGITFIAEAEVAQAAARKGRRDVVAPDFGPSAVRDWEGYIQEITGLIYFFSICPHCGGAGESKCLGPGARTEPCHEGPYYQLV